MLSLSPCLSLRPFPLRLMQRPFSRSRDYVSCVRRQRLIIQPPTINWRVNGRKKEWNGKVIIKQNEQRKRYNGV